MDGTRNPDHLLRAIADEVAIFPDDHPNDEKHVGGTYMFAGRFVHNLPKFFGMPDEEKSEIIGRDYTRVRPHHGYDHRPENPRLGEGGEDEFASVEGMPPRSHVARAFGSMMRQVPHLSHCHAPLFACGADSYGDRAAAGLLPGH